MSFFNSEHILYLIYPGVPVRKPKLMVVHGNFDDTLIMQNQTGGFSLTL